MVVPQRQIFAAMDVFYKYGKWPDDKKELLVICNSSLVFTTTLNALKLGYQIIISKAVYDSLEPSFKKSQLEADFMLLAVTSSRLDNK